MSGVRRTVQEKIIGICIDGITQGHIIAGYASAYTTMCGIDGDDPDCGQYPAPDYVSKITCKQCRNTWLACRPFKLEDFEVEG